MPTFISQVDVNEGEFQNPQEAISVWGNIREDIEELDGQILETYTVLGEFDFHISFEVENAATAFQVTQAIERYGLDTHTMRALPLDRVGELVDDV
jgi:uncharacterized protein with GYD domain